MTLESLARTIAKARHGTDAMWANYMGAAESARREIVEVCAKIAIRNAPATQDWADAPLQAQAQRTAAAIRALLSPQPTDENDDIPVFLERP